MYKYVICIILTLFFSYFVRNILPKLARLYLKYLSAKERKKEQESFKRKIDYYEIK